MTSAGCSDEALRVARFLVAVAGPVVGLVLIKRRRTHYLLGLVRPT
ncbi:hypothetical protein AABB02_13140 [Streptomyces rimosus]